MAMNMRCRLQNKVLGMVLLAVILKLPLCFLHITELAGCIKLHSIQVLN